LVNSGIIPHVNSPHPVSQTEFRQQMEAWRKLLAQCSRKPGRKCVHNLRVATLRLQASVEYWLSLQQADSPATDAARRWQRQGKKLRRALAPVRQADVSLGKLARVRGWAEPEVDGHPVFPRECLGAIQQIERRIKRRRQSAAKSLTAEITLRRKRLNRLSRKLETAISNFAPGAQIAPASRILKQIAEAAGKFPALDGENLHEFRKRIKEIRYLAEIFAPADSATAHRAATLKRITEAVGEWHDWQALTEEAARADRKDTAMAATAEFLQAQAGRALDYGLKLCRQSMMRLLNSAANGLGVHTGSVTEAERPLPHKPVVAAPADHHRLHAERSARAS
jgi:CHAD domain-containing protein